MDTAFLSQSINNMSHAHGKQLVEVAAMVFASRRCLRACASQRGVSAEGFVKTLDQCVESYLIEHDMHPSELTHVIDIFEHDLATMPRSRGSEN